MFMKVFICKKDLNHLIKMQLKLGHQTVVIRNMEVCHIQGNTRDHTKPYKEIQETIPNHTRKYNRPYQTIQGNTRDNTKPYKEIQQTIPNHTRKYKRPYQTIQGNTTDHTKPYKEIQQTIPYHIRKYIRPYQTILLREPNDNQTQH